MTWIEREALASSRLDGETQVAEDPVLDARRAKTRAHLLHVYGEEADWLEYCIMFSDAFEDAKQRERTLGETVADLSGQVTLLEASLTALRHEKSLWDRLMAWAGAGRGRIVEVRDPFRDGFIVQISLVDDSRRVMYGSNLLGIVVETVLGMWEKKDGTDQDQ